MFHEKLYNTSARSNPFGKLEPHDILVIGSLVSDISCTYNRRTDDDDDARPRQGTSNPARITQCVGGVAHNIALAAHYLGAPVLLVSVVADDSAGKFLIGELENEGLKTRAILTLKSSDEYGKVRTGRYVGNYNHDKEFLFGMADVKLMLHPETEIESTWEDLFSQAHPGIVVLDTTFSPRTIDIITKLALKENARVIIEPVSQPRAKDFPQTSSFQQSGASLSQARVDMIAPNADELEALFQGALNAELFERDAVRTATNSEEPWLSSMSSVATQHLKSRLSKIVLLLQYVPIVLVTLGTDGCLFAVRKQDPSADVVLSPLCGSFVHGSSDATYGGIFGHFPSPCRLEGDDLVSVNGAGDSLVGAVAVGWWQALKALKEADQSVLYASISWSAWEGILEKGQWAAFATLQHEAAVSPAIGDLDNYKNELLRKHPRCSNDE